MRCKECGQVLFEFDEVPHDVIWYSRLSHRLGGECPNCGHQLPDVSKYALKMRLEVKPAIPIVAE
jgi:uncharacterized Zn finger protein